MGAYLCQMIEAIKDFYGYNTWANNRLIAKLGELDPVSYNETYCSGNGTIRETLQHLLSTQWGWLSWFDGSMTVQQGASAKIPDSDVETLEAAKARFKAIDEQTWRYLNSLTDETVFADMPVVMPNRPTTSMPLWKMLMHTANHATHTRGQIVAAIRSTGLAPTSFDMFLYTLSEGRA